MRRLSPSLLLFPLALSAAGKPEWEPIAPEVWAMKDAAGKGAVVIRDRFHIENSYIERIYRFRILSEQGKSVADLPDLPEEAYDLVGRTVYPDGKVVLFDSKKDLQTKTALATNTGGIEKKVLVPPGLSANCVVDIKWKEKCYYLELARFGLGQMDTWTWTPGYPTQKLEVDVSKRLAWNWGFRQGNTKGTPTVSETSDSKTFTMENLAPVESIPFAVGAGFTAPRIEVFPDHPYLSRSYSKDDAGFWQDVVTKIYKPYFVDKPSRGSTYRDLSEILRKNLNGSPAKQAGEILSRLNTQIINLSALTYAEKAALKGGKADWEVDSADLNQSAKKSATDGWGMFFLAFSVMKDAGIKPKIAFVADRDRRRIAPRVRNPNQFTDVILGVDDGANGTVWMDPALRYAATGLLNPDYQGTSAFVVNTADWTGKFDGMGTQSANFNQIRYTYQLDIGEDQDAVKLKVGFSGYPEYVERSRFMRLEPKEQSKTLKESLEQISKSVTITKAEVANATNSREDLRWEVEGARERETGRRLEIEPFPFMQWPLYVPSKWPETRQDFIVLPYQKIHLANSRIKLPKGYAWSGASEINHSNEFGRVSWSAEKQSTPGGDEIQVVLRVEVAESLGPAAMYPKLKTFISWIEEACRRQLVAERVK
ncbi:MAG: hypothetical protein IPQ13_03295 [Holophagaceae bacterium]|nr:hypothetical protein [Holophagaceae bacterium]